MSDSLGERYSYPCSQLRDRQHKPMKVADEAHQCDKIPMPVFDCDGWLFIWLGEHTDEARIKVKHVTLHAPYTVIDVPADVKEMVVRGHGEIFLFCHFTDCTLNTRSQIWKEILKKYPRLLFLRKTIHKMWLSIEQTIWRRDDDEVISAKMILEEGRVGKLGHYRVDPITMKYAHEPDDGLKVLAWAVPEIMRDWGGRIREVSLDSTCTFFFFHASQGTSR